MENKNIHAEDQLLLPKYCLNMDTNTLNKDEIIKTFYRKEICKQNFRKDRKGDNSMPHVASDSRHFFYMHITAYVIFHFPGLVQALQ
jgi:hypothetical protein